MSEIQHVLTSFNAEGSETHENVMSHDVTTSDGLFPFRAPIFTNSRHCNANNVIVTMLVQQSLHNTIHIQSYRGTARSYSVNGTF